MMDLTQLWKVSVYMLKERRTSSESVSQEKIIFQHVFGRFTVKMKPGTRM